MGALTARSMWRSGWGQGWGGGGQCKGPVAKAPPLGMRGAGGRGQGAEQATPWTDWGCRSGKGLSRVGVLSDETSAWLLGESSGRGKCGAELDRKAGGERGDVGSCGPQEERPSARMARRLVLGDQGRVPSTREVLARRGALPGAAPWPPAPPPLFCRPQTDSCAQTPAGGPPAGGAPSAHAQPRSRDRGWRALCACPAQDPLLRAVRLLRMPSQETLSRGRRGF